MHKKIVLAIILIAGFFVASCGQQKSQNQTAPANSAAPHRSNNVAKITFVELGSVNCIPCKAMQPVMHSIAQKYGEQIQVVFYDVWTPAQQYYARDFNIRLIPTQVFLDQNGNEILRHQGFFAEEEIDRFLQAQGLKVLQRL
ncbi:MAG: thioredoxin family protein [candidate division KSB1 bacterium]|nr:thioredoxin family protein [candidate division KSB1 bacterium]MDZ7365320.1 thioredoxin family protein [candidate division KSB1 bacterium]MDZ7403187.1 thioredoxin family protein [candidate division KSB1 bacterium]